MQVSPRNPWRNIPLCGEVQDEREVKAARNPVPPTLFRRSKSAAESGLSLW